MTRGDPTQWVAGPPKREATGFTLIEVVLSVTILSILMGAMMSAILISRQAIDDGDSLIARTVAGREAVDEITSDLQLALTITESTATAVTFTVPDRTGDDAAETIRYAWSGIAGDPLTRTFNGTTVDFVGDVHDLDFTYLTRLVKAPPQENKNLLLVVGDATSLSSADLARKTQIEAWGYTVTVIDDNNFQGSYDSDVPPDYEDDVAASDVVYISASADANKISATLNDKTLGVVCEQGNMYIAFDVADSYYAFGNIGMNIIDNSHDITSPFSTGSINIYNSSSNHNIFFPPIASGADTLSQDLAYNMPVLLALDAGGALKSGGTAAGRRVMLPWCVQGSNDFSDLTDDALTITERSIDWALNDNPVTQFGYDTVFASSKNNTRRIQIATQVTLPNDLAITSITAYVGNKDDDVRYAIYTDKAGEPDTLLAQTGTAQSSDSGMAWLTIPLPSTSLTAGTYWLALSFKHDDQTYRYDASEGTSRTHSNSGVEFGYVSTWGSSTSIMPRKISIYASE